MTDAERQEVKEWIREKRRKIHVARRVGIFNVGDPPRRIHVSREFHGKLEDFLVEQYDNLGMDIARPNGQMTFCGIPVVIEEPMDPDHLPFLAAIIARPQDDLPRLIYADWLADAAEWAQPDGSKPVSYAERAEFIRVQCELAGLESKPKNPSTPTGLVADLPGDPTVEIHQADVWRYTALRRRERELWAGIAGIPFAQFGSRFNLVPELADCRRGFIERVVLSWSDFRTHYPAIRERTPLRKVRLTTHEVGPMGPILPDGTCRCWLYPGIEFEMPQQQTIFRGVPMQWVESVGGEPINWPSFTTRMPRIP